MFSLIVAILIVVLLVKCIGLVGAKNELFLIRNDI